MTPERLLEIATILNRCDPWEPHGCVCDEGKELMAEVSRLQDELRQTKGREWDALAIAHGEICGGTESVPLTTKKGKTTKWGEIPCPDCQEYDGENPYGDVTEDDESE